MRVGIGDQRHLSLCVCSPLYKRKTTRATNTKLGTQIGLLHLGMYRSIQRSEGQGPRSRGYEVWCWCGYARGCDCLGFQLLLYIVGI